MRSSNPMAASGYDWPFDASGHLIDSVAPTAAFSKTLTEAGIANELLVTHGGHANRVQHLAAIARFCAAKLAPAE